MFTNKDIEHRTVFVVNCIKDRDLRVSSGELLLEDVAEKKTLTKLPFEKILALFIVGHIRITTPLIEKCKKFGIALVVTKPTLRPVFYWADSAEANYLLRQRQFLYNKEDISIAKIIIANKIENQISLLGKSRRKDDVTLVAIAECKRGLLLCGEEKLLYSQLMGIEGRASKMFFNAYYQDFEWKTRRPRTKCDILNATMDIGYTLLFNYIECFIRMFGFDLYVGVFHRLWFKRKSLVCDLMEPFRCIIDKTIRSAYHRHQFSEKDFELWKGEYRLKLDKNSIYHKVFFDALIEYKMEFFTYIRNYYRCFMRECPMECYPKFKI